MASLRNFRRPHLSPYGLTAATQSTAVTRGHAGARAWTITGVLLGALLSLIIFFPAVWVANIVRSLSNEHIWLAEAKGSIWNGSANLIFAPGTDSDMRSKSATQLPGRTTWRLRPTWLGASIELQNSCCTTQPVRMTVAPKLNGMDMRINSPALMLPAQLLEGLGTPWNTLAPRGKMQLTAQDFQVQTRSQRVSSLGNLSLQLDNLESALATVKPLGSYMVNITGGDSPNMQLRTTSGALQLDGHGVWVNGKLRFNGQAQAQTGFEAPLNNLLNLIGKRNGAISVLSFGA